MHTQHTHTHTCTHTPTHAHTHTNASTHTHTHTCKHAHNTDPHVGAYPRGRGSNPVEGKGHFFPSNRRLYLSSFSDTLRPTQRRSLQMLDVAVPQIGVGVFHAWFFRGGADGWVTKVFFFYWREAAWPSLCNRTHGGRVSQRYRFESRRGKRALFPLIPSALSFVSLWHTHTRTRARARSHSTMSCGSCVEEGSLLMLSLRKPSILIMICKRGYNIPWNTLCTPEVLMVNVQFELAD